MVDKNKELAKLPESMARVRAAAADAIYLVAPPRLKFRALRFADDAGWRATWLTDASMELDAQSEALGRIADGVTYTFVRPFIAEGADAARFDAAYRRRYAIAPEHYAATAYEAVYAIKAAVERAHGGVAGEALSQGLQDAPIAGLSQPLDFRASRFLDRPLEVRRIGAKGSVVIEGAR